MGGMHRQCQTPYDRPLITQLIEPAGGTLSTTFETALAARSAGIGNTDITLIGGTAFVGGDIAVLT
jgi:hypothetical protein